MAGEVIGITTMYLKGGENLNFAIPINDAKHLVANSSEEGWAVSFPIEKVQPEGTHTKATLLE